MRPPRIIILVLFFAASLFLFCRSISTLGRTSPVITSPTTRQKSQFRSFFSFSAPFTLFPPNAAISLTDDNSTFFPARPAAFGPPLPGKGLSGQLWIGSGFADDSLQDGETQGEFGCSDVPGWDDAGSGLELHGPEEALNTQAKSVTAAGKTKSSKRDSSAKGPLVDRSAASDAQSQSRTQPVDDGTDDYLHQRLQTPPKSPHDSSLSGTNHADIESIQETAEITGKVVLLRRGRCGFLEKVKWAQRRGAIAVIVGDNQKGGPLIQMFARGDTSNVTIPAIFTAHTTAHLLSSLMQPGSYIEDIIDENGNPALKVQQSDKTRKGKKAKQQATQTTTTVMPKATSITNTNSQPTKKDVSSNDDPSTEASHRGWFSRLFSWGSDSDSVSTTSRPPSSGQLDWVLVDDWSDEGDKIIRNSLERASREGSAASTQQTSGDSFQIGVQDWRDPDLVDSPSQQGRSTSQSKVPGKANLKAADGSFEPSSSGASSKKTGNSGKDVNGPKGGSITPGSGEYVATPGKGKQSGAAGNGQTGGSSTQGGGIMSKIFGEDDGADFTQTQPQADALNTPPALEPPPPEGGHEGLWVTITPTSSASPFFDTLLVLVISPLITLSVVYALLILRARIRRRRWRAPKSVVDRLPVRTYHTVAASPTPSPRLPSPTSSSPTTPLLQQGSSSSSRPRPRSRTTTGVPDSGDLLRPDAALHSSRSPSRSEHEKDGSHLPSQWKKYMGRQVECVVCLEEYVDGVSRVMSLPCGHEFHADCITPWLTTRRRTCPICKGDVVRSMARGSPSSPRYEPYHDDSDDDIETGGSGSGASSFPIEPEWDVDGGRRSPSAERARRGMRHDGWLNLLSSSLGAVASSSSRLSRPAPPGERDRRSD